MEQQSEPRFEVHPVQWTQEKINRFWDTYSTLPATSTCYWSRDLGSALLAYVEKKVPLGSSLLDLGCGPGFLLEAVADKHPELSLVGADTSSASVEAARRRLGQRATIHDLTTGEEPGGAFDIVFFVETIEHMDPQTAVEAVRGLSDLVRPGGHVVVTTPNEEDFASSHVLCPDCGAEFHKMQHLSRWDTASMEQLMSEAGFQTVSCESMHLQRKGRWLRSMADLVLRREAHHPHLIYIGRR